MLPFCCCCCATILFSIVCPMYSKSKRMIQLQGMGRLFYMADPMETSFPDLASLPRSYTAQAFPYFAGMVSLEWAILLIQGEKLRLADGVFSVMHGLIMIIMQSVVTFFRFLQFFLLFSEPSCLDSSSPPICTSTPPSASTPCPGTPPWPGSVLLWGLTSATTGYTGLHMVNTFSFRLWKIFFQR